jgi:drug/metabolite transporter (DMT)-like permease
MPPDEGLSGPRTAPAVAELPGARFAERVRPVLRNGPVLLLLSSAFIGAMAVAVKVACAHLPPGEVTFLRFFGGFLLFWPFARAGVVDVRARNSRLTYLRGILSGVAIVAYFQAIDRIPVAHAVLMQNTYPMFVVLFSMAVLKERAGLDTAACFAVAFAGMALMLERGLSAHGAPFLGYGFGLISAIFAAGAVMATRTLRRTDSAVSIFYYFSLVGSLVSLPLALADFRAPGATAILALAITIGLSVAGQLLLNQAFKYTGAAQGSVVLMASTVVAAALGAVLLGDRYTLNFFIGAALIFGAVGWLTARARVKAALPEHESEPPA